MPQLHANQPLLQAGAAIEQAHAALVLLHGRGASAASILELTSEFHTDGWAYLAPQAAGATWYPYSFQAPLERNEPYLTSALALVGAVLARIAAAGIAPEHTLLLGFSQGACLVTEYVARHPQRYGGVIGLSGGLIGPDGTPRDTTGSLAGTPVFLGCSDVDPHIPLVRVHESARVLRQLSGDVTTRIYTGMGHTINQDELDQVRHMMHSIAGGTTH